MKLPTTISKFQIITLGVFTLCIIAGVIAFSTYKGGGTATSLPTIAVWGTFPSETFNKYVASINTGLSQTISVNYTQKDAGSFSSEFVAALARGQGPDAILIPMSQILPHEDKLALIPYTVLSQRSFLDTYVQEAGAYLVSNGSTALPFTIDPLVMYWNRDMFNAAGIALPPKYWSDFTGTSVAPGLVQKLTSKDQNGNIRRSAVAMGDFSNMTHGREVLGSLLLQVGNPVTGQESNGTVVSTIRTGASADPALALQYFTQFVDPSDDNYSWNKGMQNDRSAFLSGSLATYFGFASELTDLRKRNPNINFDVAPLPQIKIGGQTATYGEMYGFSLVKSSSDVNGTYQIVSMLASPVYLGSLAQTMYLPTVVNALDEGATDPYISSFDKAALISRAWLDADPAKSRQVMSDMVSAVTSGQSSLSAAINAAGDRYDAILKKASQ